MTQLTTYLGFNGNCGDAMRYYERVLNGKLEKLITMAETPAAEHVCDSDQSKVMHACLVFDDMILMAGDAPSGVPYDGMKGSI